MIGTCVNCVLQLCKSSQFLHLTIRTYVVTWSGAYIHRTGDQADKPQAKWTLTTEGQKKYGGWKPEAYDAYDRHYERLEGIRKTDEATGHVTHQCYLDVLRREHQIPADQVEAPGGKKRKTKKAPPPVDPVTKRVKE